MLLLGKLLISIFGYLFRHGQILRDEDGVKKKYSLCLFVFNNPLFGPKRAIFPDLILCFPDFIDF